MADENVGESKLAAIGLTPPASSDAAAALAVLEEQAWGRVMTRPSILTPNQQKT